MNINDLKKRFLEIYGGEEDSLSAFTSPGRVNLIGEHTDYNGGYVLPASLTLASTLIIRPREDGMINLTAVDLPETMVNANLDELDRFKDIQWGNYQLGVADELQKAGYKLTGCDMLFHDTVPFGCGLSSSAAIEVVTALGLVTLGNEANDVHGKVDMVEMARISQIAENNYIGVKCGIMDQFTSAMGKAGQAIFLNCKDLSYKYVPLNIEGFKIVLSNTKKKRSLSTVKYNERRNECERGLRMLRKAIPEAGCLGEITIDQFKKLKHWIDDKRIAKRLEHVIYEDDRVLKSVETLEKGDMVKFGQYMSQSHDSLRDLYEVTGEELDTLVEEALQIDGVIGSRMTGAGFGGCTVSIVKEDAVEKFVARVGEKYYERIGVNAEFYISEIGNGAREISF